MGAQALLVTAAAAIIGRALLSYLDGKVGLWADGAGTGAAPPAVLPVSPALCCLPTPQEAAPAQAPPAWLIRSYQGPAYLLQTIGE